MHEIRLKAYFQHMICLTLMYLGQNLLGSLVNVRLLFVLFFLTFGLCFNQS